jgi:hypothetical protein
MKHGEVVDIFMDELGGFLECLQFEDIIWDLTKDVWILCNAGEGRKSNFSKTL